MRKAKTAQLDSKEIKVLAALRQNARQSLASIARQAGMPVSTVFDKKKSLERKCSPRYFSVVDFAKFGCCVRNAFALKPAERSKTKIISFLSQHPNVNNVCRLGNRDLWVECVFRNVGEALEFANRMRQMCARVEEHHILEELKKEEFAVV